jgi:RNA polymerase sigma-B factor
MSTMESPTSRCTSSADEPLDDEFVAEQFRAYRATGDRSIRNALVDEHRWIAVRCARRFMARGEPLDDLLQVAQLGVLKAVERFDPGHGAAFPSFAVPTVMGELRRHFRDHTWAMRVPRRLKELHVSLGRTAEQLRHTLGRQPTVDELADELRVTPDDVLDALEAGAAYRSSPLDRTDDDDEREHAALGEVDVELDRADDRLAVRGLLESLAPRERTIVYLHFFGSLTQQEIGERLGLSQVHVSRLLCRSLEELRAGLDRQELEQLRAGLDADESE